MDVAKLHALICKLFSEDELKTLCFEIGVEYDDLGGVGRAGKARELIQLCQRQDKIDPLCTAIQTARPTAGLANIRSDPTAITADMPIDTSEVLRSPWLGVEVWQANQQCSLSLSDERTMHLRLQPEPFELRFPKVVEDPAIQISAWTDASLFAQIGIGVSVADIPFLLPGTGMADSTFGFGELMLAQDAHNYCQGTRLLKMNDQLAIRFSSIGLNGQRYPFSKQRDSLYLVIYIDLNGNTLVDNDEYEFYTLDFRS